MQNIGVQALAMTAAVRSQHPEFELLKNDCTQCPEEVVSCAGKGGTVRKASVLVSGRGRKEEGEEEMEDTQQ